MPARQLGLETTWTTAKLMAPGSSSPSPTCRSLLLRLPLLQLEQDAAREARALAARQEVEADTITTEEVRGPLVDGDEGARARARVAMALLVAGGVRHVNPMAPDSTTMAAHVSLPDAMAAAATLMIATRRREPRHGTGNTDEVELRGAAHPRLCAAMAVGAAGGRTRALGRGHCPGQGRRRRDATMVVTGAVQGRRCRLVDVPCEADLARALSRALALVRVPGALTVTTVETVVVPPHDVAGATTRIRPDHFRGQGVPLRVGALEARASAAVAAVARVADEVSVAAEAHCRRQGIRSHFEASHMQKNSFTTRRCTLRQAFRQNLHRHANVQNSVKHA